MFLSQLHKSGKVYPQWDRFSIDDFEFGLNTQLPDRLIGFSGLTECQNFKFLPSRNKLILASRPGSKKVTTATTNDTSIVSAAILPLSGTLTTLLVDSDNKLYKCTGSEPTLDPGSSIKTLEGEAQIIPFDDKAVILDGGYVKLYDGSTVSLAYDDGEGTRARLIHASCETLNDTPSQDLYSGGTERCGAQITTPSWTAGYTIPLTRAKFWLSKTGTPTANITAKIYDSDGSNELATATTTVPASRLTNFPKLFEFTWGSDATQDMAPETSYIIAVCFSDGDASNYVTVHGYTEASGGDCYTYDGSTWSNVGTAGIALDVYPGKPPKASFGVAKASRLYLAGDPDYEGRLWFSNVNTALDWSTSGGGGYISAVDYSSNAYPIGALVVHFGCLLIFGKEEQPYLAILSGDSPGNYAISPSWQYVFSTHKTLISLPNDIWFTSGIGTQRIGGTQEFGDLRSFQVSDPVHNAIADNWDTDAIAGYYPRDGLYVLKLSGRTNLLVCHTNLPDRPWSEWALGNSITPTCFFSQGSDLYYGGDDGHLYKFDDSLYQDDQNDITFKWKTGIEEFPYGTVYMKMAYMSISTGITSCNFDVYTDGGSVDLTLSSSPGSPLLQKRLDITGDSFQIGMDTFTISGHFYIKQVGLQGRKLKRYER